MAFVPRPYQNKGIQEVRAEFGAGHQRVVYVLPTGGGKSAVAASVCAGVYKNKKRAIITAHREELLDQLSKALKDVGIPHGLMLGGMRGISTQRVVVASTGTLANRVHHMPPPDLIFVDECHHAVSGTRISKILEAFPRARVMGLTATPQRLDSRGLGELFTSMVEGPSVAELTAMGYLVPAEIYSTPITPDLSSLRKRAGDYVVSDLEEIMDKPRITGDALDHWKRLALGKATVVFACSVKHAHDIAADFCAAGYKFVAVDGKMERHKRKRAIEDLRLGKIDGITSAEIIGEGVDVPRIECVILLRPTESLTLAMQQMGRGLRPYEGKDRCIILDHASVVRAHGFPDDPRKWSLEGAVRGKREEDVVPRVSTCPVCFACFKPQPVCPKCGNVPPIKSRKVQEVDGELIQVGVAEVYGEAADTKELERQYAILVNVAKNRGYESPEAWAFKIVSAKLANRLAKERALPGGSTNGLAEVEIDDLRARTVARAMSKEDKISA